MPASVKPYIYFISMVGMAILLHSILTFQISSIFILLSLGAIGGLLEKYLIELPNGNFFSGTLAFTFIPLIYYGVEEAVIVEFLLYVVSIMFTRTINLKGIYNVNQYIICIFLAGSLYELGMDGSSHIDWKASLFIFLCVALHTISNAALLSVIFTKLQDKPYWEICVNIIKDSRYVYVFTIILTFILAYVYGLDNTTLFIVITGFVFLCYFGIRYAFNLFIKLRKVYITSLEMLAEKKETKLLINRGHSTRVGKIARGIAEELKLPQEEIDAIHYAALFHDMGKLSLEEQIFQKRGALSIEEEKEYRKHAEIGAEMIKEIAGLDKASEYVLYHHERWDGKGFPSQLSGTDIPLGARVIAVANEADHLIYDPKFVSPKSDFSKLAGNKLDPDLVKVFLKNFEVFLDEYEKELAPPELKPNLDKTNNILPESKEKEDLQKSKIISNLSIFRVTYSENEYKDHNGQIIAVREQQRLKELMEKAIVEKAGVRDYIEDRETGNVYDSFCWHVNQGFEFIFIELTSLIEYEQNQEERMVSLYRDVMYSVTDGKFILLTKSELEVLKDTEVVEKASIQTRGDVPICRQIVQEFLSQLNVKGQTAFQILLCTSEVVTNVLKHAEYGQMGIVYKNGKLQIIVEDNGSGINLSELPKATLLSGYSSKVSMGKGFSLILKMMDHVHLYTSKDGTTVVLEKDLQRM